MNRDGIFEVEGCSETSNEDLPDFRGGEKSVLFEDLPATVDFSSTSE